MVEKTATVATTDAESGDSLRVYEIGYMVTSSVEEAGLEKIVSAIRGAIEKEGGNFIAEGAPTATKLAYGIAGSVGGKKIIHDRGYFGWLKFEAESSAASALNEFLKAQTDILRHIVFKTVREDTRAKMKAPTLREVRRTDTIKAAPRQAPAEAGAPVSEEDLEKALQDITTD